ncbi:MAG TPA: hypothetical protein VKR55_13550 [Bradyrhizobium sp.]|uniref:hypothetical protein n=1 Tax=Bradyrhizobium sp. TaxID=376 RepID=UPI002B6701D5|nr:hypothetical protein [Bradyrhizobium sp.]HLZ03158.1 hypothetical protein [Bradyrhizobium sp.]
MVSAARASAAIFFAFYCALSAHAAERPPLERGTAIIDPLALRELDHGRFGLTRIMHPEHAADDPLTNAQLFALPSMAPVRQALEDDFKRYIARHKAELPNESIGVGPGFAFQLFDRAQLYSPDTRFVLSGIVNRMDRAYVAPESCGEIRLIYRLTEIHGQAIGEAAVTPRLPMTLNVVLKAKGRVPVDSKGIAITCAEIAKRWLAAGSLTDTGAKLAETLTAPGGALDMITPDNIVRIETNLQIAHAPKSPTQDFRTDYLMKVFDYDAASKTFVESPLENQIDRDRLLEDDNLARDFKAWLLDPVHFAELDRGTILIPDRFLLKSTITSTPAGFSPSNLQPAFGLVAGEDSTKNPVFSEEDVVSALAKAAARDVKLQNIRSVAGFERRLNDMSCSGCHQTRGIGGFHFPGVDWMAAKPSNSIVVPASPHFFGDQVRRRDILNAFAEGKQPDFSRGFSSRPQLRGSTELAGTEYEDGWGAHCYVQQPKAADNDKSFASWTCAEGLSCQPGGPATRMGMCFVKTR